MNELYQAHYEALVNNGVPASLASEAALVTANETVEEPRTQEQQEIVTKALRHLNKHFQKMEAREANEPTVHHS
jgi:hypothetical protein